ncbi:MAG: chloride channel protein [Lachnospiraceae bacterium]|nr:chloride channel protein [Lachnospiraceae bacterium]
MTKDEFKSRMKHNLERIGISFRWILFAVFSGLTIGSVSTLFCYCLKYVNGVRASFPWLIFLLPAGGILIVFLYRFLHEENDTGTNLIISAIHSGEQVPLRLAPSIFLSTLITQFVGGSAGREGAALQLGGSIGGSLGKLFRLDQKDQHIMIMCGMSAAFSSIFGTPLAAAVFSMEVVAVGIMHYSALLPSVIASLLAHGVSVYFGFPGEKLTLSGFPDFSVKTALIIGGLAILCAFVSILFCVALHQSEALFDRFFKNPYLRIAVGGGILIVLTLLVGNQRYNGAGINLMSDALKGHALPYDFALKILFTVITIGAGFKGGEILPSLAIGAGFGFLFSYVTGFDPALCAAIGMTSLFCGVTNCPITSLFISFELFGFAPMPYFLIAVALSYMLSGYYGLYRSQKIIYSKYKTNYINKHTH